MMSTTQLRRFVQGAENSVRVELEWPSVPHVGVPRSLVMLASLTVAAAVLAIYGDTVIAGPAGRLLAFAGLLGVVVITPTFLARCLTRGRSASAGGRPQGSDGVMRYRYAV